MRADIPSIRSVIDQDGAVILDIKRDMMVTLNTTGSYVWDRLLKGMLIDQIVSDLSRDTGTDLALVEGDVYEFIGQLKSRRLLSEKEFEHTVGPVPWPRRRP
jgi:hypothetical protein